jgi:hypothetical protein
MPRSFIKECQGKSGLLQGLFSRVVAAKYKDSTQEPKKFMDQG